jgi:hypothetical protein
LNNFSFDVGHRVRVATNTCGEILGCVDEQDDGRVIVNLLDKGHCTQPGGHIKVRIQKIENKSKHPIRILIPITSVVNCGFTLSCIYPSEFVTKV